MKNTQIKIILTALSLVTLLIISAGCKRIELQSGPHDTKVTIDGKNNEWQNSLTYFEKENSGIGFRNDNESLYLCFVNNELSLRRQFLTRGLLLWIQPQNSKEKIGIRFPMGMQMGDMSSMTNRRLSMREDGGEEQLMMLDFSELELLGPDKDDIFRVQISAEEGIEAKIGLEDDLFVYELRINLNKSNIFPTAINPDENPRLTIIFEIPPRQQPSGMSDRNRSGGMDGGMRGGRSGGGRSGGMGSGRGGGRPGSGQGARSAAATFKLELDVILRAALN